MVAVLFFAILSTILWINAWFADFLSAKNNTQEQNKKIAKYKLFLTFIMAITYSIFIYYGSK